MESENFWIYGSFRNVILFFLGEKSDQSDQSDQSDSSDSSDVSDWSDH